MAKVMTDSTHYENIAATIRQTTGSADTYMPSQMAAGIMGAFDAAKQMQWNILWDAIQNGGTPINAFIGFAGPYWNDESFCPKYDIVPTLGAQYMFRNCGVTDMKGILERQGVKLDLSKSSNYYYMFGNAAVTRLPELDMSRGEPTESFYNARNLQYIEKLKLKDGANFSGAFSGCVSLEEITFEGTISQNLYLGDSTKLTHGTLLHIFDVLADLSAARVLTLGSANLAKLTDAEKAIATQKGWTLV